MGVRRYDFRFNSPRNTTFLSSVVYNATRFIYAIIESVRFIVIFLSLSNSLYVAQPVRNVIETILEIKTLVFILFVKFIFISSVKVVYFLM